MTRFFGAMACLLLLGACTADSGPPDIGRGSAEAPATMLVDQTVNGIPTQSGTQRMVGPSSWAPGAAPVTRVDGTGSGVGFGGMARPIPPQGGERR